MREIIEKRCKECKDVARLCFSYGKLGKTDEDDEKWYYVECDGCGNRTVRHYKNKNDAIKAWELEYTLAEYHSSKGKNWSDVPSLCTGCEACNVKVEVEFIKELKVILNDCRERLSGVGTTNIQRCIYKLNKITDKRKEKKDA